jgi:hypothetical protein
VAVAILLTRAASSRSSFSLLQPGTTERSALLPNLRVPGGSGGAEGGSSYRDGDRDSCGGGQYQLVSGTQGSGPIGAGEWQAPPSGFQGPSGYPAPHNPQGPREGPGRQGGPGDGGRGFQPAQVWPSGGAVGAAPVPPQPALSLSAQRDPAAQAPSGLVPCHACGGGMSPGAKFCASCGATAQATQAGSPSLV